MQRSLSIIADFIQAQKPTEQLGPDSGAEGPFLNPRAVYCEHRCWDCGRRQGNHLAPELDNWAIPYLRSLSITVSLSHSQATAAQAQQAFHLVPQW